MSGAPKLVLACLVTHLSDIWEVMAYPAVVNDQGEILNMSWTGYGEHNIRRELDGLTLKAYLGSTSLMSTTGEEPRIWGIRTGFSPHNIESAEHARAIAKAFSAIEKSLDRLNTEEGYMRDGDFASAVIRLGRALKVDGYYVRNGARSRAVSGAVWRKVDGVSLQWWLQDVEKHLKDGSLRELIVF